MGIWSARTSGLVDDFFVPSVLRFQSSDFISSECTVCISNVTLCTVVSRSEPNPELVSGLRSGHGICGDLLCQHLLTKKDMFLCRLLAMQSFTWRFPVTTFLTSGQDASCMFHQPRQIWPVVPECFLCAAFSVTFDGSDDATYQYHCVLDEPVRLLVTFHCILCCDFCFFTFSATRFLNSMIACLCVAFKRCLTISKPMKDFRHILTCPQCDDSQMTSFS